ncbi:hypothetical protein [Bacillus sp. HMF5848]|uniref:hypothetical protein n=1 Tax=Bacillus sp. HMF5848 TaxID=2495421 RepID=UPI0021AD8B52|nr:hypothetical protein [Bacillus sp. HMF5848]
MNPLCVQEYVKVIRKIEDNRQLHIETEHYLHLYPDKITDSLRQFNIKDVRDMTYKPFSSTPKGFLYLHTTQGVFSYVVTTSPIPFIEKYKQYKIV